jgi:hypothetical protein
LNTREFNDVLDLLEGASRPGGLAGLLTFLLLIAFQSLLMQQGREQIPYSELKQRIAQLERELASVGNVARTLGGLALKYMPDEGETEAQP